MHERLDHAMAEVFDYLGAVSCRLDNVLHSIAGGHADPYVSTFQCISQATLADPATPDASALEPSLAIVRGQSGLALRWRGWLAASAISQCLRQCRHLLAAGVATRTPWISLSVHGVDDAPVSWLLPSALPSVPASASDAMADDAAPLKSSKAFFHHDFMFSGDQNYAYVLLPEQRYWQYSALGPMDEMS